MSGWFQKLMEDSQMKEPKFLEFLKNSNHFKQHFISDNLTKSYWFKVNNSSCTVNAYLIHKDNDSELYRIRYYSKDPLDIEVRYMENLISFEEFFEIIPEEVKEDIIFHLDFFR